MSALTSGHVPDSRRETASLMETWQAMLRETGRPIGSPRTASRAEMEGRASRLTGVVWYSLTSGDVVYAPYAAWLAAGEPHLWA